MRVALVYDRLNKEGGAERVLTALYKLFPDADWYTSVWDQSRAPYSKSWRVYSSFFSKIPFLKNHHELLPLFMPFIFEAFDFTSYDLVISVGSAECKGVITKPSTLHINYCLTPTRYLYSHKHEYLSNQLYQFLAKPLRAWDLVAATRPDIMIAISTQVKRRIKKYYHRDSDIIYPPVQTQLFNKLSNSNTLPVMQDKYFLVVSRLVAYKKIETLIKAFNKLPTHNLVIVGEGSQARKLKKLALSNTHFLGHVKDLELPSIYHHAQAYLQANEEDFGISMVEAQASGTPVIAYGVGGACDIVIPGRTGILLAHSRVADFVKAIDFFDRKRFDREACLTNAQRFDTSKWEQKILERINQK